ncbi:hypothetical protein GCM10008904_09640 [Paraclostridium ghonii]|uniref:Crystaline entomocidal protoxin n=1 Tax=Paraclostridium ghonii TaxID=29358 RepID=A0ABU0MYK8_9FIRM|nr:insecticidal delta-endotoxin Cry8Ea1 family protein [Paeniclostridium ghonii]MDQ0556007.1 hypothetical protein [Paeniclostridium ghonii]
MNNNEIKLSSTDKQEILNNYPISKSKEEQLWEKVVKDYEGIESYAEWDEWAAIGLIVAGTILALSAAAPGAGLIVAGTMFSKVVGLFFPDEKISDVSPNTEMLWRNFMTRTGKLIDQKLENFVINLSIANLKGLAVLIEDYEKYKNDLIKEQNKDNPDLKKITQLKEALMIKFYNLDNAFSTSFENLKIKNYNLLLLPMATQVANMHLLLLRDGLLYAEELSLARSNFLSGDSLHEKFLNTKIRYIDYCETWYKEGLNNYPKQITKLLDFVTFNQYKTFMTINVLDIISLFPTYDVRKYPADERGEKTSAILPKTELTREVYSCPYYYISEPFNKDNLKDDLNKKLSRPPRLITTLKALNFETSGEETIKYLVDKMNMPPEHAKDSPLILGNQYGYSFIHNPDIVELSDGYGTWGLFNESLRKRRLINIEDGWKVKKIETRHYFNNNLMNATQSLKLFISNNDDTKTITPEVVSNPTTFQLMPVVSETPKHFLSSMMSFNPNDNICFQANSFGWYHDSIDFKNQVFNDRTSIIPAIKANKINEKVKEIQGFSYTGGDLVLMYASGKITVPVQLKKVGENYDEDMFYIRVRYASAEDCRLIIKNEDYKDKNDSMIIDLKQTQNDIDPNLEKLRYKDFTLSKLTEKVIGFYNKGKNMDTFTFELESYNPQSKVVIDKIEFIPFYIGFQMKENE